MKGVHETVDLEVLILCDARNCIVVIRKMESYANLVVGKERYGSVVVSRDLRRLFSPTNTIKMLDGYNYVGAYSWVDWHDMALLSAWFEWRVRDRCTLYIILFMEEEIFREFWVTWNKPITWSSWPLSIDDNNITINLFSTVLNTMFHNNIHTRMWMIHPTHLHAFHYIPQMSLPILCIHIINNNCN